MSQFQIDFFELMFLAEVCVPRQPIARAMFWQNLCDEHYNKMSSNQRDRAFEWLSPKLDLNEEDCRLFFARFNPKNQFKVKCFFKGKAQEVDCFHFEDEYRINKNKFAEKQYIKSIVRVHDNYKIK